MSLLPQIPPSGHWVAFSLARCTLSLAGQAGLWLHEEVFQGRYTDEGLGHEQERLGADTIEQLSKSIPLAYLSIYISLLVLIRITFV